MEEDKKEQEETFSSGPFALLTKAVKTGGQVLVLLRSNRKMKGRVRAFDRHMNLVLEGVTEYWSEANRKGKKGSAVNKERHFPKLFLRGDSVIYIVKSPLS